jgi:integrase
VRDVAQINYDPAGHRSDLSARFRDQIGERPGTRCALYISQKNWQMISGCGGRNRSIRNPTTSSSPTGWAVSSTHRIIVKRMKKFREKLGLPKLNFQVIQRTIATLGQKKGTPKDIPGLLRHSRLATTTDVYWRRFRKA